MTPEQINIAIAEACGWKDVGCGWYSQIGYPSAPDVRCGFPNYVGDLNAMHEAEAVLLANADMGYKYDCELNVVVGAFKDGFVNYMKLWHATAAQRAEAFLRTLNLWKE